MAGASRRRRRVRRERAGRDMRGESALPRMRPGRSPGDCRGRGALSVWWCARLPVCLPRVHNDPGGMQPIGRASGERDARGRIDASRPIDATYSLVRGRKVALGAGGQMTRNRPFSLLSPNVAECINMQPGLGGSRAEAESFGPRCEWCGAPLHRTARQRFCGPACRYACRDSERFTPKGTTVAGVCVECGAAFVYVTKGGRRRIVCSPACDRERKNRRRRTTAP